ncbi:hypothetical protein E3Q10_02840 [Wallemia mellicola]|uniref:CCD97-like C-terminal domain-containing protein n=1 Tax=Wallemia mellicola TaxID=1708541 RepID=A0A4T0PI10_9BASI|nr:hypothetical protein E3Q14_02853 [Wallemia mellicola]TIC10854.1 hypothetical protein E3Q15_02889 [Wallemia mellicola]TIC28962.1 hypothetical protein E3Q10_02840 [Wallemia mellicola]TIC53354.1 hypothetical protein E3Q05_02435 [Wallemia mellicola]
MQSDEIDSILRWIDSEDRDALINNPLDFLRKNLYTLPPNLLIYFESITTPKERSQIAIIKKRRINFAKSSTDTFKSDAGRFRDPSNFELSVERNEKGHHPSFQYAQDAGQSSLLSEYESERDSRSYTQSKLSAIKNDNSNILGKSIIDGKEAFERILLENWIDGVDDKLDYSIDFDDKWDTYTTTNPSELDEDIDQSDYFQDSD